MEKLQKKLCQFYGYTNAVLIGRARSGIVALAEAMGFRGTNAIIPSNICPVVPITFNAAEMIMRLAPVSAISGLAGDDALVQAMSQCQGEPGLVMPTHLYGQLISYQKTIKYATNNGWFILENDTLCAARIIKKNRLAIGDALLTSFGYAKTASAGLGGAILTDDKYLAKELCKIIDKWPPPNKESLEVEKNVMMTRRYLRELGRPELAEDLMRTEQSHLRHSFPVEYTDAVISAIDGVEADLIRKVEIVDLWSEALSDFDQVLRPTMIPMTAPWRLIRTVAVPEKRNILAQELRNSGVDVGINFPALTSSFPTLFSEQKHNDANAWADSVVNFWIDEKINKNKILKSVSIINKLLY